MSFDATYSEQGFVETLKPFGVRALGPCSASAPAKMTRLAETHSPVDHILAEHGAKRADVDLLTYFSEPATATIEARAFLQRGMDLAMEWAA